MISRRFKVAVQLALVVIILLYLNRAIVVKKIKSTVGPPTQASSATETEIIAERKQLQVQEQAAPNSLFPGLLTTSNGSEREQQNPPLIQQPQQNLPLRDEEKLEVIKKVLHITIKT